MATKSRAVQTSAANVTVAAVERMEAALVTARQTAAKELRKLHAASELSLSEVAPHVGLSKAGLKLALDGETWRTETAKRLLAFYATHRANDELTQAA